MSKWKRALVFALCLLPVAIVGGIFVGLYQMDIYPEEIFAEDLAKCKIFINDDRVDATTQGLSQEMMNLSLWDVL